MRSSARGRSTSRRDVELQGVSPHGLWLLVEGAEYLVPFDAYPALRRGTIDGLARVELHHGVRLHWPDLDVDIELDALSHPERYPLMYRP